MAKYDYNVIVIGGGTAGLISAYTANLLGGKVALVEAGRMGGDCLNTGCVPSKTLIASAHKMSNIKTAGAFAISTGKISVDYKAIHKRVHDVISTIAPNDSAERYRKLGIDVYEERASLVDGHTISLSVSTITARRIVLATGSSPRLPYIDGRDLPHVYTSDTIWQLTTLPKNLVVVGGGPIGSELAMAYAQLGSNVTLAESGSRPLKMLSAEQSSIVAKAMKSSGVSIITKASIDRISAKNVSINSNNVEADAVLFATGRTPNTKWLDGSNLKLDTKGYIKTDSSLRTSIPSVYACGDVIGGYQFTHVAAYEASFAGSNALFDWTRIRRKPKYTAIPWALFASPEVAQVGIAEKDISSSHTVTHFPISEIDRAIADGQSAGGIWLVSDKKGKLIGATIIAEQAASLIGEATLAINQGLSVAEVFGTIHAYPGYGDLYDRATAKYRITHTSSRLLKILKSINSVMR